MLTNYELTSSATISIILIVISVEFATSNHTATHNTTSKDQLNPEHPNFNFREYINKYNPSKAWEEIDKRKKYQGAQISDQEQLDMMFNALDQTDDVYNLRIGADIPKEEPTESRRFINWQPPSKLEGNDMWFDRFHYRNRIYDLMRQAIYQARNRMIVMQVNRERYRKSALYKMGFLTNKADIAVKTFAKVSYRSFMTCMASRTATNMRSPLCEIIEFNRRQLHLWLDVQVLGELILKNHNIAIEILKNDSFNYAQSTPKYSAEVNETLFGNFASMKDVLMAANYTISWNPNGTQGNDDSEFPDMNMDFTEDVNFLEPEEIEIDEASHDHAAQQYHKLSKDIKPMRRYFESLNLPSHTFFKVKFSKVDPLEYEDLEPHHHPESERRWIYRRCFLQFVIHTRHEVAKALVQREPLRTDKRYRLGYLFNRLRRIRTEELKLLYYLHDTMRHRSIDEYHWFYYYNVYAVQDPFLHHLIIYEKLTAHDVDLKDTINYIKAIFEVKEPYDYVEEVNVTNVLLTAMPQITREPGATLPAQHQEAVNDQPAQGMAGLQLF